MYSGLHTLAEAVLIAAAQASSLLTVTHTSSTPPLMSTHTKLTTCVTAIEHSRYYPRNQLRHQLYLEPGVTNILATAEPAAKLGIWFELQLGSLVHSQPKGRKAHVTSHRVLRYERKHWAVCMLISSLWNNSHL